MDFGRQAGGFLVNKKALVWKGLESNCRRADITLMVACLRFSAFCLILVFLILAF